MMLCAGRGENSAEHKKDSTAFDEQKEERARAHTTRRGGGGNGEKCDDT